MNERDYENDALMADALLGLRCQEFWRSEVGRFVLGRAGQDINELLSELEVAEPENMKDQRSIRLELKARRLVIQYLDEQIQAGLHAQQQIEEQDRDD